MTQKYVMNYYCQFLPASSSFSSDKRLSSSNDHPNQSGKDLRHIMFVTSGRCLVASSAGASSYYIIQGRSTHADEQRHCNCMSKRWASEHLYNSVRA